MNYYKDFPRHDRVIRSTVAVCPPSLLFSSPDLPSPAVPRTKSVSFFSSFTDHIHFECDPALRWLDERGQHHPSVSFVLRLPSPPSFLTTFFPPSSLRRTKHVVTLDSYDPGTLKWLSYATTSPVVLLDHLTSPFLVAIRKFSPSFVL